MYNPNKSATQSWTIAYEKSFQESKLWSYFEIFLFGLLSIFQLLLGIAKGGEKEVNAPEINLRDFESF